MKPSILSQAMATLTTFIRSQQLQKIGKRNQGKSRNEEFKKDMDLDFDDDVKGKK